MGYLKDCLDDISSLDDIIDESKDWLKRNYKDLLVFNGKLLVAEGAGSATGAGAGEILGSYIGDKGLITAGTVAADWLTCLVAYGFVDSVERKKASAKQLGKIGLAYGISSALSGVFKWGLTLYYNKQGYTGGEAALLGRIFPTAVYVLAMNVIGYKWGLIGKEEKK